VLLCVLASGKDCNTTPDKYLMQRTCALNIIVSAIYRAENQRSQNGTCGAAV